MDPLVKALAGATADAELAGNWSWTVWLLIPLVLVLAVVTARTLGTDREETPSPTPKGGGVSRFLAQSEERGR